ncbi:MAG: ribosome-associated translation inhibitor RaiA [Firmicutes bacterium]|jgi:putative sigma-54 modulation protein|nr:ribosome-associated translation inhibitor RaiA [Bacillota bacterium]
MRTIVKGKNIEITPALRSYATKKTSKLEKFFEDGPEVSCEVMMRVERELDIVEITLQVNGVLMRGEEKTEDMYASIDGAVEKVERQIRKFKTKYLNRLQGGPKLGELRPAVEEKNAGAPRIVRTKRFALKPMSTDEAVMQMELLGHSFFVFRNAATQEVNVVYRRQDGNYGLIEPE